jgi:hypothetical protein
VLKETVIDLRPLSALIVSHPDDPTGPLYVVCKDSGGHLGALVSLDDGTTWQDHARTAAPQCQI